MVYLSSFDGFLWFLILFVVLIIFQRVLHREIQAVFLILTRRPAITQILFAIIFLPGVFLHEMSHYLTAKILGVATGRFSLLPQAQANGKLRLGYVETASGGLWRDAIIGVAPLVFGFSFIAFAAIYRLSLVSLWDLLRAEQYDLFWLNLSLLPKSIGDFWIWFYLTIAVSSTMMPSGSDRHAWLPVGIILFGILGILLLTGAGSWMLANIAPFFNKVLRALAAVLGLSVIIHAVFILPFILAHRLLAKITRMDIGS